MHRHIQCIEDPTDRQYKCECMRACKLHHVSAPRGAGLRMADVLHAIALLTCCRVYGSSAAILIGLQIVEVALTAQFKQAGLRILQIRI